MKLCCCLKTTFYFLNEHFTNLVIALVIAEQIC